MTRRFAAALLLLMASLWTSAAVLAAPRAELDYVERVIGGGGAAQKLPLLVVLHGLGDTPESFIELFDQLDVPVRVVAPRAPDPYAVGSSWFPIDDAERAPRVLRERAELVLSLIDELRKKRAVVGLPIVTGFSQGGMLSFALAAYHPERLASALPIAGMLPAAAGPYRKAPKSFRVVAFHGERDPRISFAAAEQTVRRLKQVGTDVTLKGFPGVGHTVPPAMRSEIYGALRSELTRAAAGAK